MSAEYANQPGANPNNCPFLSSLSEEDRQFMLGMMATEQTEMHHSAQQMQEAHIAAQHSATQTEQIAAVESQASLFSFSSAANEQEASSHAPWFGSELHTHTTTRSEVEHVSHVAAPHLTFAERFQARQLQREARQPQIREPRQEPILQLLARAAQAEQTEQMDVTHATKTTPPKPIAVTQSANQKLQSNTERPQTTEAPQSVRKVTPVTTSTKTPNRVSPQIRTQEKPAAKKSTPSALSIAPHSINKPGQAADLQPKSKKIVVEKTELVTHKIPSEKQAAQELPTIIHPEVEEPNTAPSKISIFMSRVLGREKPAVTNPEPETITLRSPSETPLRFSTEDIPLGQQASGVTESKIAVSEVQFQPIVIPHERHHPIALKLTAIVHEVQTAAINESNSIANITHSLESLVAALPELRHIEAGHPALEEVSIMLENLTQTLERVSNKATAGVLFDEYTSEEISRLLQTITRLADQSYWPEYIRHMAGFKIKSMQHASHQCISAIGSLLTRRALYAAQEIAA